MILIDGKMVSEKIRNDLKNKITDAINRYKKPMGLAVVMVGDNPASKVYVRNKISACQDLGIASSLVELPAETTEKELLQLIDELNSNAEINGILVQLPLPKHLSEKVVLNAIDVQKDVDGFSPYQMGKLVIGEAELVACTPKGIMALLSHYNIDVSGMDAVIIGRSNIVGKPIAHLLLQANATVTICHTKTKNLTDICAKADLIIAAVGSPNMVTADMVKAGAVVIDVGINRVDGKLCGDVDFQHVKEKCSYITPVPGGVGPMTITMLMSNTLSAYIAQNA